MFTQEEIIEMAGKVYGTTDFHKSALFHLEAFAKLVMDKAAEREREACAVIADSMDACQDGEIGKAIRARGQQ